MRAGGASAMLSQSIAFSRFLMVALMEPQHRDVVGRDRSRSLRHGMLYSLVSSRLLTFCEEVRGTGERVDSGSLEMFCDEQENCAIKER